MAPSIFLQPAPTDETFSQEAFSGEYAELIGEPQWSYNQPHYDSGYGFSPAQYTTSHSPAFSSYDSAAHGFDSAPPMAKRSPISPDYESIDSPNYESIDSMWSDLDRPTRYLSPLSSGTSLSGADSTKSEHPQTPDASKDLRYFLTSDITYASPCSEQQGDQSHPVYLAQSPAINSWNAPVPLALPSLHMRDFELSPGVPAQSYLSPELANATVACTKSPESVNLADNAKLHDCGRAEVGEQLEDKAVVPEEPGSGSGVQAAHPSPPLGLTPLRSSTRSRRATRSATHTVVQDVNAHIHKPTSSRTKSKAKAARKRQTSGVNARSGSRSRTRSFLCPFAAFGCESVFPTKNEWKRHTAAQHLQVDFYRCDLGVCSPSHPNQITIDKGHNDFNRKDLFTQHCRRMHWDECEGLQRSKLKNKEWPTWTSKEKAVFESFMAVVRERCLLDGRRPPSKSECGVCGKSFVDDDAACDNTVKAWGEMMDHVGRHYEKGEHETQLQQDAGLREWCEEHEMGVWINGKYWLTGCEPEEQPEKGASTKRRTRARRSSSLNNSSPAAQVDHHLLAQQYGLDNYRVGGNSDDTDADGESD
ncbi:hypothetical protein DV735_g5573, partial [Chaetothyriales sp. CBS 134920]